MQRNRRLSEHSKQQLATLKAARRTASVVDLQKHPLKRLKQVTDKLDFRTHGAVKQVECGLS